MIFKLVMSLLQIPLILFDFFTLYVQSQNVYQTRKIISPNYILFLLLAYAHNIYPSTSNAVTARGPVYISNKVRDTAIFDA